MRTAHHPHFPVQRHVSLIVSRGAQVYYFENDPTHEKAQAAALAQCARDDNLRLSREEQQVCAGCLCHARAASF